MHRGNHLSFDHRRVLVLLERCQRIVNFVELRNGEVPRIHLPRTRVNKGTNKGRSYDTLALVVHCALLRCLPRL
jgi:hypothetical protein